MDLNASKKESLRIGLHECSTHEICGKFIQYIIVHAVLMVMAVM